MQNQHRNFSIHRGSACSELAVKGSASNFSLWNANDGGGRRGFFGALYDLNSFRKMLRACLLGVAGVDFRHCICSTVEAGAVTEKLEVAGSGFGNVPVRRNRSNSSIWNDIPSCVGLFSNGTCDTRKKLSFSIPRCYV